MTKGVPPFEIQLHFPPCLHFGETQCLQPAVCAHHSTELLGVWCTPLASISTAHIPLPSCTKELIGFSLSVPLTDGKETHAINCRLHGGTVSELLAHGAQQRSPCFFLHCVTCSLARWWLLAPWDAAEGLPVSLWHYQLHGNCSKV